MPSALLMVLFSPSLSERAASTCDWQGGGAPDEGCRAWRRQLQCSHYGPRPQAKLGAPSSRQHPGRSGRCRPWRQPARTAARGKELECLAAERMLSFGGSGVLLGADPSFCRQKLTLVMPLTLLMPASSLSLFLAAASTLLSTVCIIRFVHKGASVWIDLADTYLFLLLSFFSLCPPLLPSGVWRKIGDQRNQKQESAGRGRKGAAPAGRAVRPPVLAVWRQEPDCAAAPNSAAPRVRRQGAGARQRWRNRRCSQRPQRGGGPRHAANRSQSSR